MNCFVPQYIISNVNCNGPYNNSEGDEDRDMVLTSKSSGSANMKPFIYKVMMLYFNHTHDKCQIKSIQRGTKKYTSERGRRVD